ncbi:hypothetical protein R69927_03897 [Paraburkholderia domus]|jgi:hypothetical protein|uniref:Uncharacterized protein n=1 Tax=Paraburkholderia domus TaxID=2793075 RepID=A0A9N8QY28_9BURK|nr:hypothetical protein [Paraburkholderia domus]MBK5050930.1 hypothetical protein [Burkholderia sp. R-70006]MBK5061069.1 hypothetical protein [Burkholderia sp. R-70199]MBK5088201.1 hypothetical protein [Burkholderia sp. R-69927]MBK5121203.1 hypothetical protein [Burkholderia sp. R-69980]MBK5166264.1 hypothetical protein [Burkholderia sp. R-70211]
MKQLGHLKRPVARLSRQRGQAYAEYLVVTTALISILLIASGDTASPFTALVSGFKSFFSAYSFTLSLP